MDKNVTTVHGIHQNIMQTVSFDKSSYAAIPEVSPLLVASCLYFQDHGNSIIQTIDLFYCLQSNVIERNHKATLKQLNGSIYASLVEDNLPYQWRI